VATLEKLDEGDWAKVTEAERWPVGVTAHHIAGALEPIAHMVRAVAAGQSPGSSSSIRRYASRPERGHHVVDTGPTPSCATPATHAWEDRTVRAELEGYAADARRARLRVV